MTQFPIPMSQSTDDSTDPTPKRGRGRPPKRLLTWEPSFDKSLIGRVKFRAHVQPGNDYIYCALLDAKSKGKTLSLGIKLRDGEHEIEDKAEAERKVSCSSCTTTYPSSAPRKAASIPSAGMPRA